MLTQKDFDEIEKQAIQEKPDIIVCGYTAYPRIIDFKRFGEIADKTGVAVSPISIGLPVA